LELGSISRMLARLIMGGAAEQELVVVKIRHRLLLPRTNARQP
jgi:hypothetical protein